MTIMKSNEVFFGYRTVEAAEDIAVAIRADDQDWTYKVEPCAGRFVIVVYDEMGERLGPI